MYSGCCSSSCSNARILCGICNREERDGARECVRRCNGGRQALEAAARAHPLDVVDAVDAEEHALPRELRAELGDAAAHRHASARSNFGGSIPIG